MRKINENMRHAVHHGKDWRQSNTAVFYISAKESGNPHGARSEIYLHGNHIASYWHETGELEIDTRTLAEWPTVTTKSRLRALGADIESKRGQLYLNGERVQSC